MAKSYSHEAVFCFGVRNPTIFARGRVRCHSYVPIPASSARISTCRLPTLSSPSSACLTMKTLRDGQASYESCQRTDPRSKHDEVTADYNDIIYAASSTEVIRRRRLFLAKWLVKCSGLADSLEAAAAKRMQGDRLFSFTRLHQSQWRSARTTNAIERASPRLSRYTSLHLFTKTT